MKALERCSEGQYWWLSGIDRERGAVLWCDHPGGALTFASDREALEAAIVAGLAGTEYDEPEAYIVDVADIGPRLGLRVS